MESSSYPRTGVRLVHDLLSALEAERKERDEARQALENDATDLWRVTNAIRDVIANRDWVTEGRGSYEWDDDRYRDEARLAFDEVRTLIAGVQPPAARRFFEIVGHEPAPLQKLRERAEAAEASLEAVQRMAQTWRSEAEDCKGRGYLESWNTLHGCATALDLLMTHVDGSKVTRESPATAPTDLSNSERARPDAGETTG